MTRKERFERALRREEVDRLPFWVKIFSPDYLAGQGEQCRRMGDEARAVRGARQGSGVAQAKA